MPSRRFSVRLHPATEKAQGGERRRRVAAEDAEPHDADPAFGRLAEGAFSPFAPALGFGVAGKFPEVVQHAGAHVFGHADGQRRVH